MHSLAVPLLNTIALAVPLLNTIALAVPLSLEYHSMVLLLVDISCEDVQMRSGLGWGELDPHHKVPVCLVENVMV